jgi:inorganic triphosphatase YgiF
MEEVEVEIVLEQLPDVPRFIEGLAAFLQLEPQSLGMTSTFDRLLDTEDMALLSKEQSLRVRQKVENVYAGNEFRLTYKSPLREHDTLFIRNEEKLKLADASFETVVEVLGAMTHGVTGHRLVPMLNINELAREANLGPKGGQVNVSLDTSTYSLPGDDAQTAQEFVLELESHGVPDEVILRAAEWSLKELGGRLAKQSKYPRGLRLLGRL